MLPPCLLDDVEAALASIFPASASFPEKLLCSTPGFDGCLPDCQPPAPYTNGTTVCLRSCASLGFTGWSDPVAFIVAELGLAERLADTSFVTSSVTSFADNLREKADMVASPDHAAYRVCALVTTVTALPLVLALVTAIATVCSILSFAAALFSPLVQLLWSILVFNHARATV
jgi:hypothetical protein